MNKDKSNSRIIKIFQYFVQFLEIYGAENYGESAEVNWEKVWDFVNHCGILDDNEDLEHLVHYASDEEFRDSVFAYVEKQALEDCPLWRLFNMSKWLEEKCEQELHEVEYRKQVEYFNTVRCYKCKNFHNKISTIGHDLLNPVMSKSFKNVAELREYVVNTKYVIQRDWQEMDCLKRQKLLEGRHNRRHRFSFNEKHFKYKGFNAPEGSRGHKWILNPMGLLDCPYFVENTNMTADKFIELYYEISRYLTD